MKIGYAVWTWMNEEFGRKALSECAKSHFEDAVRSISHLGYETLENFNFLVLLYENHPEELKELLDKYKLQLVNLYHSYSWAQGSDDVYLDMGERSCKLLQYCGAKLLNVQACIWRDIPFERSIDKDSILHYAKVFNKMGEIAQKYGITACMHPHAQSSMFHEDEIDFFLEHTNREFVSLTMDTGHTTLAGMDAVKAFDKYGDLIKYVHFKDLDPNAEAHPDWPMHRFVALGQGSVDFKGVVRSLKKHNYDGVLCVEIDYPLVCNYETAQFSRNYLKDALGL